MSPEVSILEEHMHDCCIIHSSWIRLRRTHDIKLMHSRVRNEKHHIRGQETQMRRIQTSGPGVGNIRVDAHTHQYNGNYKDQQSSHL